MKSQQENGLRNALNRRESLPPHPNAPSGYPIPRTALPMRTDRASKSANDPTYQHNRARSEAAYLSSGFGTSPVRVGKTARDRAKQKAAK